MCQILINLRKTIDAVFQISNVYDWKHGSSQRVIVFVFCFPAFFPAQPRNCPRGLCKKKTDADNTLSFLWFGLILIESSIINYEADSSDLTKKLGKERNEIFNYDYTRSQQTLRSSKNSAIPKKRLAKTRMRRKNARKNAVYPCVTS